MDPVTFERHAQHPSPRLVELPSTITPIEFYVEIAKAILLAAKVAPETPEKPQYVLDKEADYVRIMQSEMLRQSLKLGKDLECKREQCRDLLCALMRMEGRWNMSLYSTLDQLWLDSSKDHIVYFKDDLPTKANHEALSVVRHNQEYMKAKGVVVWTVDWDFAIHRAHIEIMEHSDAIRELLKLLVSKLDQLQSS
jgi:hypothetical protein